MATEFPICVPWRSDNGGPRDDLWAYTKRQWEKHYPNCPIFEGDVEGEQFRRAWACNAAVKAAGDWDAYLIVDADTIMMPVTVNYWPVVERAVQLVAGRRKMCYAHDIRWMLGPTCTAHVLSHGTVCGGDPLTTGPHHNTFSGMTAVGAPMWETVNGFDQRFEGWGFEDLAFMHACGTLGDIHRVPGVHAHLWHPRKQEEEDGQPHYIDNWNVWTKYKNANGDPVAMRGVIEEGRQ
jgi:hypothetical protein